MSSDETRDCITGGGIRVRHTARPERYEDASESIRTMLDDHRKETATTHLYDFAHGVREALRIFLATALNGVWMPRCRSHAQFVGWRSRVDSRRRRKHQQRVSRRMKIKPVTGVDGHVAGADNRTGTAHAATCGLEAVDSHHGLPGIKRPE